MNAQEYEAAMFDTQIELAKLEIKKVELQIKMAQVEIDLKSEQLNQMRAP